TLIPDVQLTLLVDRGVEEKAQEHGRRTVYRHRHGGTGICKVEPAVQFFGVVQAANRYARIADFSVYVWTVVGIVAIEGNGIKRGRKALCRHSFAHIVKPAVRSFRPAFSGEHTGGVFGLPLEG